MAVDQAAFYRAHTHITTPYYRGEERTHSASLHSEGSDACEPTKRARLSQTARLPSVPMPMCSVAVSPTDRENLERHYGLGLDLARVNEKLNEFQQLRDEVAACRSDDEDESDFGDDKLAQLLDRGNGEQCDSPMARYEEISDTGHEAGDTRSQTARLPSVPMTMYSVPVSPTDREILERHYGLGVHLARVNEKLNEFQQLRDWVAACRSDDENESDFGDDKLAQLLDWGNGEQYDTPMTQYEDDDEKYGVPDTGHEAGDTRQWDFVAGGTGPQTQHNYKDDLGELSRPDTRTPALRDASDTQPKRPFQTPQARTCARRWSLLESSHTSTAEALEEGAQEAGHESESTQLNHKGAVCKA